MLDHEIIIILRINVLKNKYFTEITYAARM